MTTPGGVIESPGEAFRPATGLARPAAPGPGRVVTGLRLLRLHAASRRLLSCLLIIIGCAVALRIALHWLPRTGVLSREIPLTLQAAAAAAIGLTVRSPFGEPERITGRWLPALRLTAVAGMSAAAFGVLAAGVAGAHLAGGSTGLLRDLGGFTGVALLTAAAAGGGLSWAGPLGYLAIAIAALTGQWATPWAWPARPSHDHGAAICAAIVFAAGTAVITVRGARGHAGGGYDSGG